MPNNAALTVVTISEAACAAIDVHSRAGHDGRETGGILLGHERTGRIDILIAGGPGPGADRQHDYFLRDLDHARQLAADGYLKHEALWVGEWHTHPRGPAHPSARDITTYRQLLADHELCLELFVSIVVSEPTRGLPVQALSQIDGQARTAVRAWVIDNTTAVETRLHRVRPHTRLTQD